MVKLSQELSDSVEFGTTLNLQRIGIIRDRYARSMGNLPWYQKIQQEGLVEKFFDNFLNMKFLKQSLMNFIRRSVFVALLAVVAMPAISQPKYILKGSLETGISVFSPYSNLSPLGLKYSGDFKKSAEVLEFRISCLIKNSFDLGLLARNYSFGSYIEGLDVDSHVNLGYFAVTSRVPLLYRERFAFSALPSIGLAYYHNNLKNQNGKIGSSITSYGVGLGCDFLAEYVFNNRYSIGLKGSVFGASLYKWRGDNTMINDNSYNARDNANRNRNLAWSIGVVFTKTI